ncbi:hypothetical protein L3X38_032109 [Prunus dulcis]|uniref:Reverse transcriptase n=1 Tax=Prunus dulcis TaxID=3755 RepID=A0AAD4VF20_PRUDU|nr:hypothetical protein L3X38_032109 [Prunus dulcis]
MQENIIIAHEAFHILKLRKTTRRYDLGIKLEMNKAFDRVEWPFLESVMLKMGFDARWRLLDDYCKVSRQQINFGKLFEGLMEFAAEIVGKSQSGFERRCSQVFELESWNFGGRDLDRAEIPKRCAAGFSQIGGYVGRCALELQD